MKTNRSLLDFLSPERSIIRYVVGTAALTVVVQTIYDAVKGGYGLQGAIFLVIFLAIVALLLLWVDYIRRRPGEVKASFQPSQPRQGVILLVSKGENGKQLAWKILQQHASALKQVWLLSTQDSFANAQELELQVPQRFRGVAVHPVEQFIVDEDDPKSTWETVQRVYLESSLPASEMIADITGGTKSMTAGMSIACIPTDRDMQYLYTPNRLEDGRLPPDAESIAMRISTEWLEM